MRYKLCKFCENRARDTPLQGVYIPHFGKIWVKFSILGLLHPCRCTDGGEIWQGGGDRRWSPPPCQISPHRCNVSPLRGEKPQNRPLSKLNTGMLALRAMLPVMSEWVSKCRSEWHLFVTVIRRSRSTWHTSGGWCTGTGRHRGGLCKSHRCSRQNKL